MKKINTFTLKWIAIISMLIDHVGAILFPQYLFLRIIGRLAFPIFAYVLVEGFIYTHDVKKYMLRLGVFALVSEIPFDIAFNGAILEFTHQNVFFTLFLGILMLYLLVKMSHYGFLRQFVVVVGLMLLADFMVTDYGSMGLLMILFFYKFRDQKIWKFVGVAGVNVFLMGYIQTYAALAVIPLACHSGEQGPKMKWFFYLFYPVHLILLYMIYLLI